VRIAIVTLDGFNEIDSLVALHLLNRMRPYGWRAEIVGPANTVTSMNGLVIHTQRPLATAAAADVVIFGSGVGGRQAARDHTLRDQLPVDPQRQLIAAQCSGVLLMGALGLLDGLVAAWPPCTYPPGLSQHSPGANTPPTCSQASHQWVIPSSWRRYCETWIRS
jgi:transcriptional regulator GlxA family with amidase domain